MTAARAANAPQFTLRDDPPTHDIPPAVSRDPPRPRAAQWRAVRAPTRPVARWLGIGSCALLVGLLAVTMLTQPISAEIERLIRPWLEWQQDPEAAAPQIDRTLPTTPPPAAARRDPPSGSMPMLAREGFGAASEPRAAASAGGVAAPANDDPTARSVPVPSFKPPPPKQ
jgi:hypothetical protein